MSDPRLYRDAGLLREHLARELVSWRAAGFWPPHRVERFSRCVRLLARLTGRLRAEAYCDVAADADAIEAEGEPA